MKRAHGPCGGIVKPEVVLYGEPLNDAVMEEALEAIARCDLLIVAGTSLVVYPPPGWILLSQSPLPSGPAEPGRYRLRPLRRTGGAGGPDAGAAGGGSGSERCGR